MYETLNGGTALVGQWLRGCLPRKGMRVRALVGDLNSHVPQSNPAHAHNNWALKPTSESAGSTAKEEKEGHSRQVEIQPI